MRKVSAIAIAAVAWSPGIAASAAVSLSPAVVEVGPERPWADVSIRNDGDRVVELQAAAFGWEQDEAGHPSLSPARDVGVFPRSARMDPHDLRRFRISVPFAAGDQERAYRLVLDLREAGGGDDAVVTRALVPVFVEPVQRSVRAELEIVPGPRSRCRIVLRNEGTVRIRPPEVTVAVRGRDGTFIERALDLWWVLAGGVRTLDVELPIPAREVREVVAQVRIGEVFVEGRSNGCAR